MLRDFQIRNFRCFDDLLLDGLGRVNLIVGKNNVGKSALLEALRLYAGGGAVAVLRDLLKSRDEHRYSERSRSRLPVIRDGQIELALGQR